MSAILFLGLKGGVGTSAAAVATARTFDIRTTLVDLDLPHGDLADRLDVRPVPANMADLAGIPPDELDTAAIRAVTYTTATGRIELIPSPAHPELAEHVSVAVVRLVLETVGMQGPVIVDGGSVLTAQVLEAAAFAREVVLVGRDNDTCLRQVRAVVDVLERSGTAALRSVHVPGSPRGSVRLGGRSGLPAWAPPRPSRDIVGALRRLVSVAREPVEAHVWRR